MNPQSLCMGCMTDIGGASICPHCGFAEKPPSAGDLYLPPRTLLNERYLIGRILGEGGFGITYLAYDLTLTLKLAVKEFLPRGFATRAADGVTVSAYTSDGLSEARQVFTHGLEKFLEEARILARFNDYSGIVAVRDFFATNGTGYLVMNYLDGMTLKQYVTAQGERLPFPQALQLLSPVMETLQAVHAAGLTHRDISPDNIYITRDQQVKLIDFGAARFAITAGDHSLSIIFKRGFAPMEQYHTHGRQGPWTDVYALAGTLYYTLTGRTPPESPARVLDDPLQLPSALGVAMPGTTEAVLLKGLAIRLETRYRTIDAMQQAFMQAMVESDTQVLPVSARLMTASMRSERVRPGRLLPTEATTQTQPSASVVVPPGKNRWLLTGGLVTLILASAMAGWMIWQRVEGIKPPVAKTLAPPAPPPVAVLQPVVTTPTPTPLSLQLETPRGFHPVYRVGEFLELTVEISQDGYLYCYYRDEEGKIARIYPNRYTPDSYLRAGQKIAIPGAGAGFSIEFSRVGQSPEVLCLASPQEMGAKLPAQWKVADLEPINVASLEVVAQTFQMLNARLVDQRLRLTIIGR